jgi:hypothetical protein
VSTAICVTFAASALALAAPTLALAAAACAALASTAICATFAASTLALATLTLALAAASAAGSERDTASSSTGNAECDGVSASSAARESVAADIAFRLVLDASPDGLSVLSWQRLPGCEQQRVLPSGRMEPRLLW